MATPLPDALGTLDAHTPHYFAQRRANASVRHQPAVGHAQQQQALPLPLSRQPRDVRPEAMP